ncbi:hypothetical protein ZEAMMB73_Zm00001d047821 [Zea mays]|uniref:Uncharacterized protein n=1 Tax=Zea mays TaxID=4577 RepID=A0A1D6PDR0_MAIZE|nr:hypothetical protein ZEAMMB73_Zm00001d047821 [Zea mays]
MWTNERHITWTPISCHYLLGCSFISERGRGCGLGAKEEREYWAAAGCERGGGSFHQSVHPHPQRLMLTRWIRRGYRSGEKLTIDQEFEQYFSNLML